MNTNEDRLAGVQRNSALQYHNIVTPNPGPTGEIKLHLLILERLKLIKHTKKHQDTTSNEKMIDRNRSRIGSSKY